MPEALPDDVEALKAALAAMRARADLAEAELAVAHNKLDVAQARLDVVQAEAAEAKAQVSDSQAFIAHLKLQIAKLRRERFGTSSERADRLLDQLELQLEELEASASEDELVAEIAAAKTTKVAPFERKRPSKKPFPEHLNLPMRAIGAAFRWFAAAPVAASMALRKTGDGGAGSPRQRTRSVSEGPPGAGLLPREEGAPQGARRGGNPRPRLTAATAPVRLQPERPRGTRLASGKGDPWRASAKSRSGQGRTGLVRSLRNAPNCGLNGL